MERSDLFPARLLGFGFYWAWLFLTCVSPSLLFGKQLVSGLPLEAAELAVRLIAIIAIILFAAKADPTATIRTLLIISLIAGTASSLLLIFGPMEADQSMVVLMGAADASMFMLWLCFFGNERVGQVAIFLAASYSLGAVLTLLIAVLPFEMACICTSALPLLSCITYWLSYRRYVASETPAAASTPAPDPLVSRLFPFTKRICVAIALYALIFALTTSTALANSIDIIWAGPAIEAPCCLIIGVVLAIVFWKAEDAQAAYRGYQIAPLALALGVAFVLAPNQNAFTIGCALIMLGYLLFEILALNDLCNAVKLNGLSAVKTLGAMRIGITSGMLAGWMLGVFSPQFATLIPPHSLIAFIAIPSVVIASTLVFTEKEIFAVRSATQERLLIESEPKDADPAREREAVLQEAAAIETEIIRAFGEELQLSKREMDVLPLLIEGKTAVYISEQLYIAPGTVKTHIYNIYQKLNVHSKMEMLDAYHAYRDAR